MPSPTEQSPAGHKLTPLEQLLSWLQVLLETGIADRKAPILTWATEVIQESREVITRLSALPLSLETEVEFDPQEIFESANEDVARAGRILNLLAFEEQLEGTYRATQGISMMFKRLSPTLQELEKALEKVHDDFERFKERHGL